ncbi:MAG: ribosomal protein S18-alanine N-acetyltransferase [Smithellaceae bacterium]|nr:ribosomal protein S18-alanine N-acetyltransferase [Smithellaceae bacterium]
MIRDHKLEIYEMAAADLPEVLAIENAAFAAPWSERMFQGELKSQLSCCRVARVRQGGGMVLAGYLIAWIYAGEVHIHNLAVKDEFRRQSVASLLVRDMLDQAGEQEAKRVFLEVRRSNAAAIGLYEKTGFRVRGIRKGYYRETDEDALVMGLELGSPETQSIREEVTVE